MAKKYYWLKLKEDFFRDKRIKKLRKIAGGDTFTIIYLKMQLLSLKNEGALIFESVEDSFAEEIALEIDEDVDNVKVTLMFLQKNGLLEEVGQDHYVMTETIKCIGSESASAERVRKHRKQKDEQKALQCNTQVTICNTEIEIEKDIEKDKEIDKDKIKHKYGEYQRIRLTDKEYTKLCNDFSKEKIDKQITLLDEYIESNNNKNKYTNFNLVLRRSIREDWFKPKQNVSKQYTREEIIPDWFNKETKTEEPTKEDKEEMQRLLDEITEDDFEERKKALQERLKSKYKPNNLK